MSLSFLSRHNKGAGQKGQLLGGLNIIFWLNSGIIYSIMIICMPKGGRHIPECQWLPFTADLKLVALLNSWDNLSQSAAVAKLLSAFFLTEFASIFSGFLLFLLQQLLHFAWSSTCLRVPQGHEKSGPLINDQTPGNTGKLHWLKNYVPRVYK